MRGRCCFGRRSIFCIPSLVLFSFLLVVSSPIVVRSFLQRCSGSSSGIGRIMPFNNNKNNKTHKNQKRRLQRSKQQQQQQQSNNTEATPAKLERPLIVGPDSLEVLQGTLFGQAVAIVLCGESHEDSLDVTRTNGIFEPHEGWIAQASLKQDILRYAFHKQNADDNTDADITTTTAAVTSRIMTNVIAASSASASFGGGGKHRNPKLLTLTGAKEWGQQKMEEMDIYGRIVLLWVRHTPVEARKVKGQAFLLQVLSEEEYREQIEDDADDDDDDVDDSDEDEEEESWYHPTDEQLPAAVRQWIAFDEDSTASSSSNTDGTKFQSFEWGDLDSQAFDLNRRRLTEEDIATEEIDTIIEGRKLKLRNNANTNTNSNSNSSNGNNNKTIWTWDDWFDHIRKKSLEGTTTTTTTKKGEKQEPGIDVELILEASVPPWELSLHRPELQTYKNNPSKFQLPQAADLIRCMPEDGDEDEEDEYDPSSDGVGSYLDYIYRRFMEEEMITSPVVTKSHNKNNKDDDDDIAPMTGTQKRTSWLHCVDVRDLGCQSACRSDSVKEEWKSILTPNEASELYVADNTSLQSSGNEKKNTNKTATKIPIDPPSGCRSNNNKNNDATANNIMNESNGYVQFVPESRGMNPERIELEKLRSAGKLVQIDDDDESDDDEDIEEDEFTYPSFEGFFGQNTDYLYYSLHVNLYYSPFLAKCVKSLGVWEQFFTNLFLGGTIPDALDLLDLDDGNKKYLYVRSPIQKVYNAGTGSYEYSHRDDGENYITYPFFPFIHYLYAKDSSERTYSSELFARVCSTGTEPARIADAAKTWTYAKIQKYMLDPKNHDDANSGGEWFYGYLFTEHREIYDDIDRSDPAVLLGRNKIKSLTTGRKHNIGKISIPSCKDGFNEITQFFDESTLTNNGMNTKGGNTVSPRVEILAKILIDIWMSCLVDFTTILKIAEIVSKAENRNRNNNVLIVTYMGSAHTRAVSEFCVNHMGFTKKAFIGKVDWAENESRTMKLPEYLWDINKLFS